MRTRARGFTVMEVMMSLGVLALGASGVIAVQRATLLANTNARNLATANSLAQTWMERLQVDAIQWNDPAGVSDLATDTRWLNIAIPNANPAYQPAPLWALVAAPGADITGADNFTTDPLPLAATAFCVHLSLTSFPAASLPAYQNLVRAKVRVIWAKGGMAIDCSNPPADLGTRNVYGAVYITGAVKKNLAPQ